jgi:Arc/MetJ-type ribon-helix-helix transcriptional regulator
MARNTSVEIGDELGTFIDSQIRTGRYNSASEGGSKTGQSAEC